MAHDNYKNDFIAALAEHLQALYGTNKRYIYGEGNAAAKRIGGAGRMGYFLVGEDPFAPKNYSGVAFEKDLCRMTPRSEKEIVDDICRFMKKRKGLERIVREDPESVRLTINGVEYAVHPHIEEGYAGEIRVYLTGTPFQKIKSRTAAAAWI